MMSLILGQILLSANFSPSESPIDRVLDQLVMEKKIPGAVVHIRLGGKTVYERAVGVSNLETGTPMPLNSVHELASVSKQFTAAAVLLMVEDGKLKLDESIDRFLEGEPEAWKKVTVRQLLHHTSGLPDYITEDFDPADNMPMEAQFRRLYDKPLSFEPGEKWEYSNTGYMLLGHIVNRVDDRGFYHVLRTRIFEPAGMKTAVVTNPRAIVPNRAFGYSKLLGQWVNEEYCAPNIAAPGDGMVSASAADLIAWHEAMMSGKVLKKESWEFLFTPSKQSGDSEMGAYSAGLGLERVGERPRVTHSGGWFGTMTFMMSDLERDNALVVLINTDGADPRPLLAAFREQFPELD